MTELIHELPGLPRRLGRHKFHDPRSRAFDAVSLIPANHKTTWQDIDHPALVAPWDQGDVGSCTANAALGVLVCYPNAPKDWQDWTEGDAQAFYRQETRLDERDIPGVWEPEDTGSTGLWSMKVARQNKLITSYRHCFSVLTVLGVLASYPVSIGVPWYNSMFEPDSDNALNVDPSSGLAGGHQVALVGMNAETREVRVRNSWGTSWGDGGHAWLHAGDLEHLLHAGGDAVVPVL